MLLFHKNVCAVRCCNTPLSSFLKLFSFRYLQPVVGRIPLSSCWVTFVSWMWVPTWVLSIISDSDLFTCCFYLCSSFSEMTLNSLNILISSLATPICAHIHTPLFLSLLCLGEGWGVQAHVGGDLSVMASSGVKSTFPFLPSSPPRFCRLPKRGSGGAHL